VEKALSRSPADRFRSAGAFEEALRAPHAAHLVTDSVVPLELRVLAKMARIGAWLGGIGLALAVLGFVNGMALNVVLGRPSEYAPETPADWFVWGVRSLIGPAYHAVTTLFPLLFAGGLLLLFGSARRGFRRLGQWVDEGVGRIGFLSPAVLGAGAIAAIVWWHSDLIGAIYRVSAGRIDVGALVLLSPSSEPHHLSYRRSFTFLIVGLVATEIAIRGWIKWNRRTRSPSSAMAVATVIAGAVMVMNFPWRIWFQSDFPRVQHDEQTCYEVGQRQSRVFLFCPLSSSTRTLVVERSDPKLVFTGVIESAFSNPEKSSGSDRP
jgi:hypothetical protein